MPSYLQIRCGNRRSARTRPRSAHGTSWPSAPGGSVRGFSPTGLGMETDNLARVTHMLEGFRSESQVATSR
jgi:hypothetical protein